jgi:hypothetical protein
VKEVGEGATIPTMGCFAKRSATRQCRCRAFRSVMRRCGEHSEKGGGARPAEFDGLRSCGGGVRG